MRRPTLIPLLLLVPVLALSLPGCTANPATGGQTFTGTMSTAEEIRIGRQEHPKIIKTFGGTYGGPKLADYVAGIGQRLARNAERRDITYKFTVLNSDIVNAFAMPGGYIYISRGLLALASDEAELAAVLAHEIGHLTALHHGERQGQDLLAQLLVAGLGIAAGRQAADVGGMVAGGVLRGFSREQELQSDDLGIRYMARAGFDPGAMAAFLRKLRAEGRLQAKRRRESPDSVDAFNYLATHPAPQARVSRAAARAKGVHVANPRRGEDTYLGQIDGMLYGDDPAQGFIRGRVFAHPSLRFRFEVPPGFRLFNSEQTVVALGPKGATIQFDMAAKPADGPMPYYLSHVWGRKLGVRLNGVEGIAVNGLQAATGRARIQTRDGAQDVRLVAIRFDLQRIFRFLFLTPVGETARHEVGLRRTTYSFRLLDEPEAAQLRPLRIRIRKTAAGDTLKRLADKMAFEEFRTEWFQVLNGLTDVQKLAAGSKVKIVTE